MNGVDLHFLLVKPLLQPRALLHWHSFRRSFTLLVLSFWLRVFLPLRNCHFQFHFVSGALVSGCLLSVSEIQWHHATVALLSWERDYFLLCLPRSHQPRLVKQMEPLANCALVRIHYKHGRLEATLTHALPLECALLSLRGRLVMSISVVRDDTGTNRFHSHCQSRGPRNRNCANTVACGEDMMQVKLCPPDNAFDLAWLQLL